MQALAIHRPVPMKAIAAICDEHRVPLARPIHERRGRLRRQVATERAELAAEDGEEADQHTLICHRCEPASFDKTAPRATKGIGYRSPSTT